MGWIVVIVLDQIWPQAYLGVANQSCMGIREAEVEEVMLIEGQNQSWRSVQASPEVGG